MQTLAEQTSVKALLQQRLSDIGTEAERVRALEHASADRQGKWERERSALLQECKPPL